MVPSQIQQSHLEENYHHFCVNTCHINRTKNSANTSSLEETTIISQTNFNKLDPLTAVMSSLLWLKPSFRECLYERETCAAAVIIDSLGAGF